MSYRGLVVVTLTLAGCASARSSEDQVDASTGTDASTAIDAPFNQIDAFVNPPDAPAGCTVMTRNLLVNGNFDATPIGNAWVEAPINATYPIVTSDGTLVQSAPNKAWMGGLEASPNTDSLFQEVVVPAGTTSLVLTGFYEVRTGELLPIAYDRSTLALTTPTNAVLQQVLARDNTQATTSWTAINHTFASPYAGQTVRVRMTTTSDATDATSFYFDSLALTATYCQ